MYLPIYPPTIFNNDSESSSSSFRDLLTMKDVTPMAIEELYLATKFNNFYISIL